MTVKPLLNGHHLEMDSGHLTEVKTIEKPSIEKPFFLVF